MLSFLTVGLLSFLLGVLKKNAITQVTNHRNTEKALSKCFTGARDRGGNRVRGQRQLDDAAVDKVSVSFCGWLKETPTHTAGPDSSAT